MAQDREKAAVTVDQLLGTELHATGVEIKPGSYPGMLRAFGEPFMIPASEKFKKPGSPEKQAVFEASFLIRLQDGSVEAVEALLNLPSDGINRKSKLWKMLKVLNGDKGKFIDMEKDVFKKGATLAGFVGLSCLVVVDKNSKDWPVVKDIAPSIDGVKYPTAKEAESWLEKQGSEDVPF
jgi:hypothetical protein